MLAKLLLLLALGVGFLVGLLAYLSSFFIGAGANENEPATGMVPGRA